MEHEQQEIQEQQNETNGPRIEVFDIPTTATADEAARLLNEPYERGFYVYSVVPWHGHAGVGARVFARRLNPPRTAKPFNAAKPLNTAAPAVTKEDRAMQFLRDNREMTTKQLVAAFRALGVNRSAPWISKKRIEVIKADRRVV